MVRIKQAVILAGGLGTRLRPLTYKIPKPMIRFNKQPFLEHLINMLKKNGVKEVVLLLGYLPEKIIQYFGDGSKFGLKIKYSSGELKWDTGKRIKKAKDLLDDHFLLMYCDNYWPLDLKKLVDFYNQEKVLMSVTVYTNKYGVTKSNMLVDKKGYVSKYDKKRKTKNLSGVEIGYFIVDKKILKLMPKGNYNFEKEIFLKLIKKRQLRGFLTDYTYYSVSTTERLPVTRKFLKPKKVVILDRDGVINQRPAKADYVKKWDEFKFLPGALEALRLLNQKDYEVYIISNQAGIARGLMTEKDIKNIHQKMKKEIKKYGGKIEDIYYCLHGWNDGCECRKPKPGMLFQATHEHHFDLTKAVLIGDDKRDLQTGRAAGCKSILASPKKNLLQIVKILLKEEK